MIMVSRLLCVTLTALLAATSLVADSGIVTLCSGRCTLHRDGASASIVRGANVRDGDRIESAEGARVVVVLDDGSVVTLDNYSMVDFRRFPDSWTLEVITGEVRIAHDGESPLQIRSGAAYVHPGRAIVRIENREEVLVELVAGEASAVNARAVKEQLEVSFLYTVTVDEIKRIGGSKHWDIEPTQVRLASAIQLAPELQLPQVPDLGSVDSVNNSSSSDIVTTPFSDPEEDVIAMEELIEEDDLEEIEDEEDELRVLPPEPVATRSSQADDSSTDTSVGITTANFGGSASLSLGAFSGSTFGFSSGGLFADAGQQTFQGQEGPSNTPFPGSIHLVTAESRYAFNSVQLNASELTNLFGSGTGFYSIAEGKPAGQVLTNFFTGTNVTPTVIPIPKTNLSLVALDQYAIPDPADPTAGGLSSNIGLTGLIGTDPTGPTILGATPLEDDRATFNQKATFALGEFLVTQNGSNGISFNIRSSDQDRTIVKDLGGNDANDQVETNENVDFVDTSDPRFLPQAPSVKVPDSYEPGGTDYSELDVNRRAAFTTLVADRLFEYAKRTNQTRFVVDGKIVDIRGYQPPSN